MERARSHGAHRQGGLGSRFQVVLERPQPETVVTGSRRDKIHRLRAAADAYRRELLQWADQKGLADRLSDWSPSTAFNVVFVTGTPEAAKALAGGPHVVDVAVADEIPLQLPKPAGHR